MGPILQERTTSTILKRVPVKEKIRVKNSENTEIVTSNNKTGGKVSQNQKPQKKASLVHKNVISGQDKEPLPRAETKGRHRNQTKHVKSPNAGMYKMLHTQFEADIRHPRSKPSPSEWEEKRQKVQHQSPCCTEVEQSYAAREKSRRALSLPLAPHQFRLPANVRDLESLRLLEHKEDDTDSASDLSDSERLPVLPSPCTPPQLNLRAEIVDSVDLHPDIPGPRTVQTERDSYNYPDFLPPPFNTWSLRQLAVFLNTEGKRAPRPKPVGQLEMFLERLLQLEWHQVQTIQNESSQPTAANVRIRGRAPNGPQIASLSRPHTAPPTRLSSPKSMRQSQRPFPFTLLSSLGSPSSCQLSRCLYCHARYPLCNGSCSSYTYQRHSRLSPLLERKTSPSITHKRSSSESRASALENKAMGRPYYPVSPKSHQKQMEADGSLQKVSQELSMKSKRQPSAFKGHNGRAAEAESHKDPPVGMRGALDKRVGVANKRDSLLSGKREQKEGRQTENGGSGAVAGVKRFVSENNSIKGSRADRKLKKCPLVQVKQLQ
ncbi:uncharacterized protein fam217ba isoform X1 [Ictalurus punctatus]|uniref:Uncharacterized protein fam217ba isoform X1 n=1 Tax=Ictalurus punctatus TaxID=7998 RepID=A0A2D0SLU8_ICTPU|nr:uncharacterized protein fam217ba isoform X1 [Ictalurus punctatus]XP_017343680.1 uncharacterized protein fam217ba isoform X1 [Ictalurus punctatus]